MKSIFETRSFLKRISGVTASSFFAFHTILKTSKDYYEAMRWARLLADNITAMINGNETSPDAVNVFPYSVFYVFYEQVTMSISKSLEARSFI